MKGGITAQRGFYIQGIVTLLAAFCYDEKDWDELEAEVESNNDKIDYGFYKGGKLRTVAQVKSTQNVFNKADIGRWLCDLHADMPDADEYFLILAGNTSQETNKYIDEINAGLKLSVFNADQKIQINRKPSNLDDLSKIYRQDLFNFMSNNGVTDSISPTILDVISSLLEQEFQSQIFRQKKWERKEIIDFLVERLRLFAKEAEAKYTPLSIISSNNNITKPLKETSPEYCLDLREMFNGRFLLSKYDWNDVIQLLYSFVGKLDTDIPYKLCVEAGYTISFTLGRLMNGKSGFTINYVQKSTNTGTHVWYVDSSSKPAPNCNCIVEDIGNDGATAVAIGFSQNISDAVKAYITCEGLNIKRILYFSPTGDADQLFVLDGNHAWVLAQYIANEIQKNKEGDVLLFPACPGSVCFMLGQLSLSFGHITMYEYDYEHKSGKTYYPTYTFF